MRADRQAEQEAARREAYALALVEGASIAKAGEAGGISRATAYRWYGDAAMRARVRELQAAAVEHARQRLRGMLGRALDVLDEVMADGSPRGSHARLAAAQAVLKAAGLADSGEDAAVVIVSHVPRDAAPMAVEAVSVRDDAEAPTMCADGMYGLASGGDGVYGLASGGDGVYGPASGEEATPRAGSPASRDQPADARPD